MLTQSKTSHHPDVMVSSTYTDLTAHRKAVCDALIRLGFFPVGMEYDSAKSGKDVIASSLEMIARAQAYIGIIGHRYGGVPKDTERNPNNLSITEIEYREAIRLGLPVYMFLMSDDHSVTFRDVEPVEDYQVKLRALKDDVRLRSICPVFSSVEQLHSLALQSIVEMREHVAPKASQTTKRLAKKEPLETAAPRLLAVPSFISGHEFVGRRDELAWLDAWATDNYPLMVVEAIGGAGKSTLAWQWLNDRARVARPDLCGLLWYSFYEGGADMGAFAATAFAYVTGRSLADFRGRKTSELARLLVGALRERPFLLVLDGLERVLVAYHRLDASQARDDEVRSGKDDRACIKPSDGELLRQLVASQPSKILITSRLLPTALLNRSGQILPGVRHRFLGGLHSDDALLMIRKVGVKGDEAAIRRYLTENFDNHPQIVGVVAGLVKDYVRAPGNFNEWAADQSAGAALHLSKLDLVQRQTHILAAALSGLDPGVRQVLSRIAALGSAVPFETVEALNPYVPRMPEEVPAALVEEAAFTLRSWEQSNYRDEEYRKNAIKGSRQYLAQVTKQRDAYLKALAKYQNSDDVMKALPRLVAALHELEQRGLLQWDREKNTYDLHPVVRGYAFDVLEQTERAVICADIADHFRKKPADRYTEIKTLGDVQQSMDIFRALIQAQHFGEALRFYRGDFANALSYTIEAYHEIVALLKPLFPNGFAKPPIGFTSTSDQSYLLNNAAVALILLGRLTEARAALISKMRINLDERQWSNLRICLTNLGETFRDENKLAQAHATFELAMDLANVIQGTTHTARALWYLMDICRITGQFTKARAAYRMFQALPIPKDRELYRAGDVEEELCWLGFLEGSLTDSQLSDAHGIARAGSNRTALRSLVRLRGEFSLQERDDVQAITAFESAIEMAQAVGLGVGALEARLALARARVGDIGMARDLCDRLEQLEQPPSVELAGAYLALGDLKPAKLHALAGYSVAWADGPPYSRYWELKECRQVLTALGEPEPDLPGFDPALVEPVPCEADIRIAIKEAPMNNWA